MSLFSFASSLLVTACAASALSCHSHVVFSLIPPDLGPVSVRLVFQGPRQRLLVRLLPSVCLVRPSPLPFRSRLLDRCQSPTLGLSTLQPRSHRGNYSLGVCLLSRCSTIYHQSVHTHLSCSPLHPDITGPQASDPQVLQLPGLFFHPPLSLPPVCIGPSLTPHLHPSHPSAPSLFPGNQPSLEASGENPSSPRSVAANHNGLSDRGPPPALSHRPHHPSPVSGPSLLLLSPAEAPFRRSCHCFPPQCTFPYVSHC